MVIWSVLGYVSAWLVAFLGFGFGVWRQAREDFEREVILGLLLKVGLVTTLGMGGAYALGAPVIVVGIVGEMAALVWLYGKKDPGEVWGWIDLLAKNYFWWVIFVGAVLGKWIYIPVGVASGICINWLAGNYKRLKIYPSGKEGVVALFSLIVWSGIEIVIEFVGGPRIYWGGLSISQWVLVGVISVAVAAVYFRSKVSA